MIDDDEIRARIEAMVAVLDPELLKRQIEQVTVCSACECKLAEHGCSALQCAAPHAERLWRVGRSVGRTVYIRNSTLIPKVDSLIGVLDTREWAGFAVDAANHAIRHRRSPLYRAYAGLSE